MYTTHPKISHGGIPFFLNNSTFLDKMVVFFDTFFTFLRGYGIPRPLFSCIFSIFYVKSADLPDFCQNTFGCFFLIRPFFTSRTVYQFLFVCQSVAICSNLLNIFHCGSLPYLITKTLAAARFY